MKRALVVGLLPGQAECVRQALGGRFRLRFKRSEHAQAILRTTDINVVLLDYVDHGAVARIERLLQPGQRILYVRGLHKNVIAQLENECLPSI